MNHPVLSIDVAKRKSVAAAYLSSSQLFSKPFSFEHSFSGVGSLLPLLSEMESRMNAQPHVVREATGNYSKPLISFFTDYGFPVFLLNPILTHQLKSKAIRKVKTDAIDAALIAQVYYLGNGSPATSLNDSLFELRTLTRQHHHLNGLKFIPGVGKITASVILAEIGDIKKFPGSKQLSAFAGLDASVFESGTFTASRNRISKRGSSYLRTALYQATVAAVSQQCKGPRNPTLSRYYQ